MESETFVPVAEAGSIAEKSHACFEVNSVALVICRFRGEYFALENLCSHARSTFDEGRLRAYNLMCPLHGATFDIRDGSPTSLPARRPIRSFPTRINNGMVEVDLGSPAVE